MKYSINPACTTANVGDEVVVLNAESGVYFSLNEVGGYLWDRIKSGPVTPDELVSAVVEEYDTDEATCREDIMRILYELSSENLIFEE
jgi:hypothetical protein